MRGPGRPRSFDPETVIDRARDLFWRDGAGAPLDALCEVTGLHKPSLYSSFGGKRGLYLAALDDYLVEMGRRTVEALAHQPLRTALERFFATDLKVFGAGRAGRGCFLMSTAIDAASGDREVRQRVEQAFSAMRVAILERVRTAVARGDLRPDADAETVADLIGSTHVSLSVEARAGTPRRLLEDKVKRLIDLIVPQ